MILDIMGTPYTVTKKKYDEDPAFERLSCIGYCDEFTKEICLCDTATFKNWGDDPPLTREFAEKETLRHEIVHAFFNESGLSTSSNEYEGAWAKNEEMVDWIAIQGPKIVKVWEKAGVL